MGGCNKVSCNTGCHIAWFSEDLTSCKAQCAIANSAECEYTWHHAEIGTAGFNPWWEFGIGIQKCWGSLDCGCPTNDSFGLDCDESACEAGCDLAHSSELRDKFFHGESVIIDDQKGADANLLLASLTRLSDHVNGVNTLTTEEIKETMTDFKEEDSLLDTQMNIMEAALNLIDDYESTFGPLFLNSKTTGGFPRDGNDDLELERAILQVQQSILDDIYRGTLPTTANQEHTHPSVISTCSSFLDGRRWKTADYFPGYVDPPTDDSIVHNIIINATMEKRWGRPVCFDSDHHIRPTGLYLSPGKIATVMVPESLVGTGFQVRVGAADSDNIIKDTHLRMDRVTTNFDINNSTISIANPLGGGIYIRVPYLADEGAVAIDISGGVVQSPLFSMTTISTTSEEDWNNNRRFAPGPWADFESDNFLLNIPRAWMFNYDYDHAKSILESYIQAMDGVSEIAGYPPDKRNNYVLYVQPDLHIRAGAFGVGYPQVNNLINADENGPKNDPESAPTGMSSHWFIADGGFSVFSDTCYHELGHCQLQTMYDGETEASNNLFSAYVRNVKAGVDFDQAFSDSFRYSDENGNWIVNNAAINWMVTVNFREGNEMDKSNTEMDEMRYQHRGYAKYADIARLYGWQVLQDFYHEEHLYYEEFGNNDSVNDLSQKDDRTLRLSISAGVDLMPLIHFWGIHPDDETALRNKIQENELPKCPKIFNLLSTYGSIIPMSNAEFIDHFDEVWPGKVGATDCDSPLFGCGWYNEWRNVYNETHGSAAFDQIQNLLDKYFGSQPTKAPSRTASPTPVGSDKPSVVTSPPALTPFPGCRKKSKLTNLLEKFRLSFHLEP